MKVLTTKKGHKRAVTKVKVPGVFATDVSLKSYAADVLGELLAAASASDPQSNEPAPPVADVVVTLCVEVRR